jgi:hypothetical protein
VSAPATPTGRVPKSSTAGAPTISRVGPVPTPCSGIAIERSAVS